MDTTTAASAFRTGWEERIGPTSAFSHELTPEGRTYRRILADAPGDGVAALLAGVTVGFRPAPSAPRGQAGRGRFVATACAIGTGSAALLGLVGLWLGMPAWTDILAATLAASVVSAGVCLRVSARASAPAAPSATPSLTVDEEAVRKAIDVFERALGEVAAHVRAREEDAALGFDVTTSKGFGDWVQKFVDYVNGAEHPVDLQILKDELLSKLRTMGISVYEKLQHDRDGQVRLPVAGHFRDDRATDDGPFTRVTHAVVSSPRGILAVGSIL